MGAALVIKRTLTAPSPIPLPQERYYSLLLTQSLLKEPNSQPHHSNLCDLQDTANNTEGVTPD